MGARVGEDRDGTGPGRGRRRRDGDGTREDGGPAGGGEAREEAALRRVVGREDLLGVARRGAWLAALVAAILAASALERGCFAPRGHPLSGTLAGGALVLGLTWGFGRLGSALLPAPRPERAAEARRALRALRARRWRAVRRAPTVRVAARLALADPRLRLAALLAVLGLLVGGILLAGR